MPRPAALLTFGRNPPFDLLLLPTALRTFGRSPTFQNSLEFVPMRSSCKLIGLLATVAAPALLSAQSYPSAADPRSNLKPGRLDAGVAASNMRLVSFSPKPALFDST